MIMSVVSLMSLEKNFFFGDYFVTVPIGMA